MRDCNIPSALLFIRFDDFSVACNTKLALTEYKVTTKVDVQHVVGVIQHSHTAFSWDDDAYTRYSELMRVLTTATKVQDGKHVKWGQDCIDVCAELYTHITNRPMAYWSPHTILTEATCLIALTDASDDAVANSLFVVVTQSEC